MTEEELQEEIEKENTLPQAGAKAYQQVFAALNKTPDIKSSPDFINNVMALVEAKRKRAERMDMVYMLVGIFGILVMASAALIYFDVKLELNINLGFLNSINSYVPFIITGGLMIALIQFLDKKFVRGKLSNT